MGASSRCAGTGRSRADRQARPGHRLGPTTATRYRQWLICEVRCHETASTHHSRGPSSRSRGPLPRSRGPSPRSRGPLPRPRDPSPRTRISASYSTRSATKPHKCTGFLPRNGFSAPSKENDLLRQRLYLRFYLDSFNDENRLWCTKAVSWQRGPDLVHLSPFVAEKSVSSVHSSEFMAREPPRRCTQALPWQRNPSRRCTKAVPWCKKLRKGVAGVPRGGEARPTGALKRPRGTGPQQRRTEALSRQRGSAPHIATKKRPVPGAPRPSAPAVHPTPPPGTAVPTTGPWSPRPSRPRSQPSRARPRGCRRSGSRRCR